MWKGMIDYWLSNGTDFDYKGHPDHWGQQVIDDPRKGFIEYHQGKASKFGRYNMTIYEPCNYVSNIAYYRSTTKICDYGDNWSIPVQQQNTLKRLFSVLAAGSAFMHGSLTNVGNSYDVNAISLISAFSHKLQVLGLKSNSSILHQLSEKPRRQDLDEVIENIT